MKKTFLLLSLLYTIIGSGQNAIHDLNGTWIKVKSEMKDGSKLFSRHEEESTYVEFKINTNQLCINYYPFHSKSQDCVKFNLENDFIKTSPTSGYTIEKITDDSLKLTEKIAGLKDDKLRRYYLVKQETLLARFKEENKNNKNIVATANCTPKTTGNIGKDLVDAYKMKYGNFKLIGHLIIYPGEKKIQTVITYASKKDSPKIQILKKVLDNSFKNWDLTNFNEYESITLPFVVENINIKHSVGIDIIFFSDNLNDLKPFTMRNVAKQVKADELFKHGILAFQEKNYAKAIASFSECYEKDPKNLDALYNKAAALFQSGDKEKACKVWKEISNLGQVTGKELHHTYCE
ncbi:tetratricopeptide repeat protein [Flavobacterium orientale]|uniref:Tetratricopeptide repeat-containing protein n=1 Tax=Flavobacterium orientale TaxID=1756020 RepID=A0A917DF81_9FLAO|nr:tetratricopeptide repeat protein [Flavobacterium orientale]GGD32917.1 hypothetical protein GCM10011343_23670 [Flavobacterium orientale]